MGDPDDDRYAPEKLSLQAVLTIAVEIVYLLSGSRSTVSVVGRRSELLGKKRTSFGDMELVDSLGCDESPSRDSRRAKEFRVVVIVPTQQLQSAAQCPVSNSKNTQGPRAHELSPRLGTQ